MSAIGERFKNAYNAFMGRDPTKNMVPYYSYGSYYSPWHYPLTGGDRSTVSFIYNKIAVDCSSIDIKHVRIDDEDNYESTIKDSLNYALTKSANIDQTGRKLIENIVESLLDEGFVAVVPIDTDRNPANTDSYNIYTLRVGKILEWFPLHVKVEVYNEKIGKKQTVIVEKRTTAIIENPFYSIMNEPNSTAQRLMRVLSQVDRTNEDNSAGKMDLIIQLPYMVKNEKKKGYAETRRRDLEQQLSGSQYGIGYIDGTEKVIQLNRSVENNLWNQAKDLMEQLFNQMGLAWSIFDGTANEETMLNYYNRTIEPIMTSIVEEMERKWLSITAVSQGQAIRYFRDPFKLVPVKDLAEISDKFTRNEIMTSNEIRSKVGLKPSDDPRANELRNSNLNHPDEEVVNETKEEVVEEPV